MTDLSASDSSIDVLHISEAYGGGVQTAIAQYIENSPYLQHELLVRSREEHDVQGQPLAPTTTINASLLRFVLQARDLIRVARPKIVHLHSSFAGLLRIFEFPGARVVYTPHSYSFMRTSEPKPVRLAYLAAELLLSQRPQVIAAISPHETALAAKLASDRASVAYLPNVTSPKFVASSSSPNNKNSKKIVITVGRIAPQKDPLFYLNTVNCAQAENIEWVWVGDGDADTRQRLEEAGISVTGWLPNEIVLKHLASADLYFHPAAWEGAPITLLEASSLGLPVLTREVPTLTGLGFPSAGKTPEDASARIIRALSDAKFYTQLAEITEETVRVHSRKAQSTALQGIYGLNGSAN